MDKVKKYHYNLLKGGGNHAVNQKGHSQTSIN